MCRYSRLPVIIACLIVLAVVSGCKTTSVRRNTSGPGGLPRGIVEEGAPPPPESDYPVYPGSVLKTVGVYETTDSISTVGNYFNELLGITPLSNDPNQETLTFETDEFTLLCLPLPDEGGTEIRFTTVGEGG
ncbi:MAG: hypothetical protein NTY09_03720 [bacterium]|nr:hypothetical protein [bacterium]